MRKRKEQKMKKMLKTGAIQVIIMVGYDGVTAIESMKCP